MDAAPSFPLGKISSLGGGGRACFNTPFVSSWFSSLAWFTFGAGPGPAEKRQDQIEHPLPHGERALQF